MMLRRPVDPRIALRRLRLMPAAVRRLDAMVARRINGRAAHPALDRSAVHLSRAADRGVLWFSLAGALTLAGHRRAGARGAASLTLASILANLVGKKIFGGDRPLLKDVPVGRRLRTQPTSPSFPSGHSASAAGFAAGVALESPRVGAAIGPVAGAVAYSRLHTGAHWFSDVVGGITIGVAVATAGKALVPARSHPQPRVAQRAGGAEIALPASLDGDGVLLLINPSSGRSVWRPDPSEFVAENLPAATVRRLTDGDDLAAIVRDAFDSPRPPTVLGVCGGDGTVASVAHQARSFDVPLLVLPGGTFNHFARAAGLESVEDAVRALRAGEGVRADVAELTVDGAEPLTVLNAVSLGVYPAFVAERERRERYFSKWLGGLVAAIRVLRRARPVDIAVEGRRARVWSVFVGVDRNHPATVAPMQRVRLDDGVLDVRVLHAGARLHAVAALAFGRRTSAALRALRLLPEAAAESRVTGEVTISVQSRDGVPARLAHDGEVLDGTATGTRIRRATVRIRPGALRLYSPRA